MNVTIVVPRRPDGGQRDRLWEHCRSRWTNHFPEWSIVEGNHDGGPFNRSAAINAGVAAAADWDVLVIIDSDVLADPTAVAAAVDVAAGTGRMVLPHNERIMLNKAGTEKVLAGHRGSWRERSMVETVYTDSISCVVAVSKQLWERVGGFDPLFVGWGFEDSAFTRACMAVTGKPYIRLASELFHLWHPPQEGAHRHGAQQKTNRARLVRYEKAHDAGDVATIDELLGEARAAWQAMRWGPTRIPRILHRTVPTETSDQVEAWWTRFGELHPGWDLRTWRDPLEPADWPLTSDLWPRCANGAQRAGLIRLEALHRDGGIYVDSDVEPFRSLEPLLHLPAFAAWEDETTVPDAVLGAEAGHPAFETMIAKARASIEGGGDAWLSGPGVATEILPNRPDVLVLPPGAFYPHHYLEKAAAGARTANPWVFVEHHWHHSWGNDRQRQSIAQRQRT